MKERVGDGKLIIISVTVSVSVTVSALLTPLTSMCVCLCVLRLRDVCQNVAGTKQFDLTILFFIALNCITLAMERPDIPAYSLASDPEWSMGPFCVTRSNPTHRLTDPTQPNPLQVEKKFRHNPTRPDTTNNGACRLVVTHFYTRNLSRTFSQLIRAVISLKDNFSTLL